MFEDLFDAGWKQRAALVVVDMQRYYLEADSVYCRFCTSREPGSLDYFHTRCRETTIPNIQRLIAGCRTQTLPVVYLRLCGAQEDRSDLHRFFRDLDNRTHRLGLGHSYPTRDDPWSQVIDDLKPAPDDAVFTKTTYSGFTSSSIEDHLRARGIRTLLLTGLCTSQCVETTGRDASDRGFDVVNVEDAQADYDLMSHRASLFSSRGVCGGQIYSTDDMLRKLAAG